MQLRNLFPSKGGFHIDPLGNNAGDVWKGTEHVGLVSKDKTTGKWICTHNACLTDGDPRFVHEHIMDAVLAYVTKYPDIYSPGLINLLKGMQICFNAGVKK
jgi:hypothetical protein